MPQPTPAPDPGLARVNPPTRVPLRLEEALVAASMAAIALITAANVVVRYFSNASLAFTEEYSVVLMVVMTLLGTATAVAGGRHVRIDWFAGQLPPGGQRVLSMLGLVLVCLCFALLAWHGGRMAYDDYRFEVTTPGLGNPQWIYTAALPVLSAVVLARAVGALLRLMRA